MNKSQFKKLQKQWYKKLAADGFEDIEDVNSPKEMLKVWHNKKFLRYSSLAVESTQAYYLAAEHLLNTYPFKSERDKKIWARHANGESLRDIAKVHKSNYESIRQVIVEIAKEIK